MVVVVWLLLFSSGVDGQMPTTDEPAEEETQRTEYSLEDLLGISNDDTSRITKAHSGPSSYRAIAEEDVAFQILSLPRIPLASAAAIPLTNVSGVYRYDPPRLVHRKVSREFRVDENGFAVVPMTFVTYIRVYPNGLIVSSRSRPQGRLEIQLADRWIEVSLSEGSRDSKEPYYLSVRP